MATIKVRVNGEIATNLTPEVRLVCQNEKYDVEFEFDESWSKSNFKTALFIYNGKSIAVPFDRGQNKNVCKIPALYDTELLHIGVKSDDIGGLHTSTPARVGCLLSANDIANGEIPNPTPSQYDEIIALLNKYIQQGGGGGSGGTDEERVREIAEEVVDDKIATEIPTWAKEPTKPSYTAEEVGALPSDTPMFSGDYNDLTNKPEGLASEEYVNQKADVLSAELTAINTVLEQSGLVTKYKSTIEDTYNERITAGGLNVLDGSKAVLKKVVGNTVKCNNLIPFPYVIASGTTKNGVTLTYDEYGVISLAGKNESNEFVAFNLTDDVGKRMKLKAGTYKYSQNVSYDMCTMTIGVRNPSGGFVTNLSSINAENKTIITIPQEYEDNDYQYHFTFSIRPNVDVNGFVVKLMFNEGSTALPYQPYFEGLKNSSFAGLESTNADGTEVSTLNFPKTELGEWDEIDFEKQKVVVGTRTVVFDGTENWADYTSAGGIKSYQVGIPVRGIAYSCVSNFYNKRKIENFELSNMECQNGAWIALFHDDNYTTVAEWKAHLAELYASGKPLMMAYELATPTEETIASGNEYKVYSGGTEKVLGNDNAEYGVKNTLSQNYIIVTGVK